MKTGERVSIDGKTPQRQGDRGVAMVEEDAYAKAEIACQTARRITLAHQLTPSEVQRRMREGTMEEHNHDHDETGA